LKLRGVYRSLSLDSIAEVATITPSDVWDRSDARIRKALESLATQVSNERSTLHWTINGSRNEVKPLHLVMTLELRQKPNDSLVYSLMFTSWQGPTVRHSDLMVEDGDILVRLPDDDLGMKPSEARIEQSVDQAIDFIANCKDSIVQHLPDVS